VFGFRAFVYPDPGKLDATHIAALVVYVWQQSAPDAYYDLWPGNFLNAALSFVVMLAVFSHSKALWAKLYGFTAIAQVLLNLVDVIVILEEDRFNFMVDTLNGMEFLLLFFAGGIMALRNWYADRCNRVDTGASHSRHL